MNLRHLQVLTPLLMLGIAVTALAAPMPVPMPSQPRVSPAEVPPPEDVLHGVTLMALILLVGVFAFIQYFYYNGELRLRVGAGFALLIPAYFAWYFLYFMIFHHWLPLLGVDALLGHGMESTLTKDWISVFPVSAFVYFYLGYYYFRIKYRLPGENIVYLMFHPVVPLLGKIIDALPLMVLSPLHLLATIGACRIGIPWLTRGIREMRKWEDLPLEKVPPVRRTRPQEPSAEPQPLKFSTEPPAMPEPAPPSKPEREPLDASREPRKGAAKPADAPQRPAAAKSAQPQSATSLKPARAGAARSAKPMSAQSAKSAKGASAKSARSAKSAKSAKKERKGLGGLRRKKDD